MFNCNLFYFVGLITFSIVSASKTLPEDFPVCKRNDPNINKCLKDATGALKSRLLKGVTELGIEPIEPFYVDKLTINQQSPAVNFTGILKNAKIHNCKSYEFSKFNFDPSTLTFDTTCKLKNIKIEADFNVEGKVLILPIRGDGQFYSEMGEVEVQMKQQCVIKNKKGEDYILPNKITTSMKIINSKINLKGLFKDKAIDDNLNKLINENIDLIIDDLKSFFEDVITRILSDKVFAKIQGRIPYDKLFPIA